MTKVEEQLAALVAQIAALSAEVRELHKENMQLRRQLEAARGVQQHQPYAVPPLQPPLTPTALCPLPPPNFPPVPPSPGDITMDTSTLGSRPRELGNSPEAKRPSGAARTLALSGDRAAGLSAAGSSVTGTEVSMELSLPDPDRVRLEAPTSHAL
jgi:hypothetical protein